MSFKITYYLVIQWFIIKLIILSIIQFNHWIAIDWLWLSLTEWIDCNTLTYWESKQFITHPKSNWSLARWLPLPGETQNSSSALTRILAWWFTLNFPIKTSYLKMDGKKEQNNPGWIIQKYFGFTLLSISLRLFQTFFMVNRVLSIL